MKRLISLSVVDQALLSAVSLGISVLLIKFATAHSVGAFAVASSMTFLAMAVQNALVTTPIAVRTYGIGARERTGILATLTSVDLVMNVALSSIAIVISLAMGFSLAQAAMSAFYLSTSLVRELARGILIADENVTACIQLDGAFVLVATLAILVMWQVCAPEIACLAGLAIGNAVASRLLAPVFHRQPALLLQHARAYPAFWSESRWMLIGATATEMQERSYVFMLQSLRGVAAVGTIHAGRFLISPLNLLTTAWGRATRPRMAALLRDGRTGEARSILCSGVAIVLALTLIYVGAMLSAWRLIDEHLFAGRYANMWPVVVAWCGYGIISVPSTCLGYYYQADRRFLPLAFVAVASASGSIASLLILLFPVPDLMAIACMWVGAAIAFGIQLGWWLGTPTEDATTREASTMQDSE